VECFHQSPTIRTHQGRELFIDQEFITPWSMAIILHTKELMN